MNEASDVLQIIDRILAPITSQLGAMADKLDRVVEQTSQISVVKEGQDAHRARLETLETDAKSQGLVLAGIKGRNSVILWAVGIIGAACSIVGAAGVIKMLGWG